MIKTGIVSLIVSIVFVSSSTAMAQDYKTALGIRISSVDAVVNNSITFKQFLSERWAAEGLLSFSDPVAIGALLEKHHPLFDDNFTWLLGGGAYVAFGGDYNWGLQGIVGLDYRIRSIPFNIGIDWKPELNIAQIFALKPAVVAVSARFVFR